MATPSRRSSARRIAGFLLACVVLLIALLLSVAIGSKDIPLGNVLEALTDNTGRGDSYVIWDLRVPRTVVGLCVGLALGVSGALIQA